MLNLLLPRFVQRKYENEAARLAEEESQTDKDPFSEGWLIAANASNFQVVEDVLRLKTTARNVAEVDSVKASAYVLDLSDCTEATQAQKRGERCLKALMDKMPRKPVKWGSSKSNLDALTPKHVGDGQVKRMWNGELAPDVHPLYR